MQAVTINYQFSLCGLMSGLICKPLYNIIMANSFPKKRGGKIESGIDSHKKGRVYSDHQLENQYPCTQALLFFKFLVEGLVRKNMLSEVTLDQHGCASFHHDIVPEGPWPSSSLVCEYSSSETDDRTTS